MSITMIMLGTMLIVTAMFREVKVSTKHMKVTYRRVCLIEKVVKVVLFLIFVSAM